jgi:tetratricopeptide (TPR) repeat protein
VATERWQIEVEESQKSGITPISGVWKPDAQHKTSTEKSVQKTLRYHYFLWGVGGVVCSALIGYAVFRAVNVITYVDPVKPDYTSLDIQDEDYWVKRTIVDIQTADHAQGSRTLRLIRLQRFVEATLDEALHLPSEYSRIMAVFHIAVTVAQKNLDINIDGRLQKLGNSSLAVSMRNRVLVSQALMNLRLGKIPAAKVIMGEYNRLGLENDLKLNSAVNEESFSGTVTVFACLKDKQGLKKLFERELESAPLLSLDQQMRVYRLIAGEQVRVGFLNDALITVKHIKNPVELSRAYQLMIAFASRPPNVEPVEPVLPDLPAIYSVTPLPSAANAESVVEKVIKQIVENNDLDEQVSMLLRIAGSRLMCDAEIHKIFRFVVSSSSLLSEEVKPPVLKLLNDPESDLIRSALNMMPRINQPQHNVDPASDDWASSKEVVSVEIRSVDSSPLKTLFDQQWVQSHIAIAQSYQTIGRFPDAVRVLRKASSVTQKFSDPAVRTRMLLKVGEQQIASGAAADAQKTFLAVGISSNEEKGTVTPEQLAEMARFQIIGRLFEDALKTIEAIPVSAMQDEIYQLLIMEEIRIHSLEAAAETIGQISKGKQGDTLKFLLQSSLNIARGEGKAEEFAVLKIPFPDTLQTDQERFQCCGRLIQEGFLHRAAQTAEQITDQKSKFDLQSLIVREYLLLYNAYVENNDRHNAVRDYAKKEAAAVAVKTNNAVLQTSVRTTILTAAAARLQNDTERISVREQWVEAMAQCRSIASGESEKAVLFAKLILARIALEKPNLRKTTYPLLDRTSAPSVFDEIRKLIEECLEIVNHLDETPERGETCSLLAKALAQLGRTQSAHTMLDNTLETAIHLADQKESVSLILTLIPILKGMNESDSAQSIYNTAISIASNTLINVPGTVEQFDWRLRDSELNKIVRSQLEQGFLSEAASSLGRMREPVLRDRLLRAIAYIYLDQGNFEQAESAAKRMTILEARRETLQTIFFIKRRTARESVKEHRTESMSIVTSPDTANNEQK